MSGQILTSLKETVTSEHPTYIGGGTDINRAVGYCQSLIRDPRNTILVLISDLYEGGVEKNHEFIRQVLPKKTSFDWLTQDAIDLMMSHINSYPRARLNDESPFEVAEFLMEKQLLAKLNLQKIPAKDVILRPTLLKMYRIANLQQEPIHQ